MQTDVPKGWSTAPLGQLATRVRRPVEGTPDNIAMITSAGGFVPQSDKYSRFMAGESLKNYVALRRGEFAYNKGNSKTYPQGCIYRQDEWGEAAIPSVYISFRINGPALDSDFAQQFFAAGSLNYQLKRVITSGARSNGLLNLSVDDFFACSVALPPLPEQKKIAAILSSVDEAIQATQEVIDQTRRVKEGLLQDLLTRGIGHTRFKESPIGEIPEGWEVKRLDRLSVDGIRNGIFRKREDFGEGTPLVNVLDCFTGPPVDLSGLERLRANEREVERFGVHDGDLLFIRSSLNVQGIGHTAIILGLGEPTVFECHIMRVRPKEIVEPRFLFHYTQSHGFRRRIMGNAQTTTMTTLPQDGLGSIRVPVPPLEEQHQIAGALDSLDEQVQKHNTSLTHFNQVKAGLLQDLLTGKVRVSMEAVDE